MPPSIVRVWDLPVRLAHWLLVLLCAFSWWSAEEGRLDWHRLSGYAVLGLVVFRIVWGLVGSETARFASFLRGPKAIAAYLSSKSDAIRQVGHNPVGGWAVVALLGALLVQAVLGLFAVDVDGIESGPLAVFVSFDAGRAAASAHHLVFNLLLGLIGLHLLAIAFYALAKRQNLIGPMLSGKRRVAEGQAQPAMANPWIAVLAALLSGGVVYAASNAFWLF